MKNRKNLFVAQKRQMLPVLTWDAHPKTHVNPDIIPLSVAGGLSFASPAVINAFLKFFPDGHRDRWHREKKMGTNPLAGVAAVLGRVMLCLIFVMSAFGNKIPNFKRIGNEMAAEGIPMPEVMLAIAIVFLVAGSAAIIVGYKARIGAAMLLVFLILASYYYHDFWTWKETDKWVLSSNNQVERLVQQVEMISFMKNLALSGAMLFIVANGSGVWSLEKPSHTTDDEDDE